MTDMAEVKAIWKGGMVFEGKNENGNCVTMDSSPEHGGSGMGLFPTELFLISIGGCTAMDVISILKKKKQDVKGLEVIVRGSKSPDVPKRLTDIEIEYVVRGDVSEESLKHSIELSQEKYCTVSNTIGKGARILWKYRIDSTKI